MFPNQSFHNPAKVLFLHNHLPLGCLSGHCTSYPVHPALARLHHYRHRHHHCVGAHQVGQVDGVSGHLVVTGLMIIPSAQAGCGPEYQEDSVKDTAVWRWREELQQRVSRNLAILGLAPS